MESSGIAGLLFLAASMVATIAAIVLSFHIEVQWSVALGVVAVIFAIAGMAFVLADMKRHTAKNKKSE